MLDGMYVTKSISTGLYPNLDLWTANKLQLQLLEPNTCSFPEPDQSTALLHILFLYDPLSHTM